MKEILGWIILAVVIVFLSALVTEKLWDALMPVIFGLPKITIGQALGLLVLTSLFFYRSK